jgi:hypothetical protein
MFTADITRKTGSAFNSQELFTPIEKYNTMYENSGHICNIRNAHLYRYLLSPLFQNVKFDTDLFLNGRLEFSQFKLTDFFL